MSDFQCSIFVSDTLGADATCFDISGQPRNEVLKLARRLSKVYAWVNVWYANARDENKSIYSNLDLSLRKKEK